MARRRTGLLDSVAVAFVLIAAPLAAQSTNEASPPAPVPTPAPTPAPAGDVVGPPQLRDFNLNGTVTQPAQPVTTPTPTPSPAPRTAPAPVQPTPGRTTPAPPSPSAAAPDSNPAPDEVTVDLPPTTAAPLDFDAPVAAPPPTPVADAPPQADAPGTAWWPWLAALLALALGAGLLWRRRQQRGSERYAADNAALGAMVAAPDAAAAATPRATPPATRPVPPAPLPGQIPPRDVSRQPAPAPVPAPVPDGVFAFASSSSPAPGPVPDGVFAFASAPPAAPPSDGIISSRLKPELAFELVPIRAETDAAEGAALTFDLVIVNQGSAPARDILIEARLINAGPQVDAEVGRFFAQPAGGGERLPMIAPMARVSIRTRIGAAAADLAPLLVEGRKLFVPVVAINALYRWSGGELKDSSSFLVGRGEAEGGKMAPFRLDRGARSWSDLAARLHSSGLKR